MNHRLLKTFTLIMLSFALLLSMTACGQTTATTTAAPAAGETTAAPAATTAAPAEDVYIAVVSKGFQHQFWQTVYKGAQAAADELGVTITFEGPPSESDIQAQVQMLDSALAKKPVAIALAALSTESVTDQLNKALTAKIPVIGFDSGVPNAPAGSVYANASTDNKAAGALAAENVYPAIKDKLAAGTTDMPVVIAVLSQDAVGESVTNRTLGFVEKMAELVKAGGIAEVASVGHDKFKSGDEKTAKVLIDVGVSATTSATDIASAGTALLSKDNVVAIFGSNEAAANGILDASNEGVDLASKGILAVGFDAGKRQKAAVSSGVFMGSITQDPYNIGYKAVELAFKAYKGESVADIDTGAKFYTKDNMTQPDIGQLLYD
ncbi:MAG: ABC transporter substrate-binding protein [Eubacteriales bacterium]|nr:ABC transporter substrate-binding protein [Eubacteriales bacterium]